ncbi:MAG TPA: outer membrane protein assembly factor BamA [Candidatus Barnesiella excrementipullorum]|uniref:Outer membrane protein assembly factor BamA n=1 Tax=Candidatus Barnesiella excrementipullorum TaxID=2838479 RepID=A0A9D2AP71_9BACT|nr:outer membrane protein assembly factor BamA [Candidatus Barnesiella excrementipullorum]
MSQKIKILFAAMLIAVCCTPYSAAQTVEADTIYNPTVVYSQTPQIYEIADITVVGADNYEDYIIIGYSGLSKGQRIEIPGDDITNALKRFWRQGLFSDVAILWTKAYGDKAWLEIRLTPQPRISQINYNGVKKGEREDLEARLGLAKGQQITPNIVNRAEMIIKKYFDEKGFKNADVRLIQHEDLAHKNEVILDINVDKNEKIKVHRIYFKGNNVFSDFKLKWAMKKTSERDNIFTIFKQKKFVESDFESDLQVLTEKYNEKGYRDAYVVCDSIVPYDKNKVDIYISIEEGDQYHIRDIRWIGNTIYTNDVLSAYLGMKPGDVYNQKLLNKRINEDEDAVSNLYMDRGYLFFNLIPLETNIANDSIDLEMMITEGPQARINKVIINGNDRLYEHVIRRELRTKPGELFDKSALIRSAREIAQTGHFDPESMDIQPKPNPENGTVDIELNLTSKSNDQIEFSAGWGQTGIIGKLSLKFTNFSMRNLFNPKSYKGIIPQGDGQTFTISAQTNARYYQAYSISFFDPWFGGKRPNSFSVSAYYSRQTGIESSFYNNNYYNPYLYGGYYGGYGGYYDQSYYQAQLENAIDPSKSLQMAGINFSFGKRLSWPDDYFTFMVDLGYQAYILDDWDYLYYMNNGVSHSITLGATLARTSIDNPIYTRRGSQFSLSATVTPPYSLFDGKDYKALSQQNTEASRQEMYRWIEYYKIKFKSRTYTPLTSPENQYTLVLMTRADFGLLGSYNPYKKSPFETFYVGGDGMTGSYTYATETIGMRGYDNGAFTPWGYEGYAYTRFTLELHFPFLLQPSTTIYGLAFAEAGNAWTDIRDFNPFSMKRSAGVGVRVFLPMIGLLGIDWAYGFDEVFGQRGGSHFHFILGQEF